MSDPIYLSNAGLVICAPFLPRLFEPLGFLEKREDGSTRLKESAASRAVHLLQYLVDKRTSAPEPQVTGLFHCHSGSAGIVSWHSLVAS